MQSIFFGFDAFQWYTVGVIFAIALFETINFGRKWIESGKTLQYDFGFLVNGLIGVAMSTLAGYTVFLPLFSILPIEFWYAAAIAGVLAGAGMNEQVIKTILKVIGFFPWFTEKFPRSQ